MRASIIFMLCMVTVLSACGEDKNVTPETTAQTSSHVEADATKIPVDKAPETLPKTSEKSIPGRSQYDPVPPEIANLPNALSLDPCDLLDDASAAALQIPLDQRIERIGGTRKIPEDHRYTPYIGCIWRSVHLGVPRASVEIQQSAENLKVNGESLAGLGDAAWYTSRMGRDELRVHHGDTVIFVKADIRHDSLDTKDLHIALAKQVLKAINADPDGSRFIDPSKALGAPKIAWCETMKRTEIPQLLPGPTAWALPVAAINQTFDPNQKSFDSTFVGCVFAGKGRGSVRISYLGEHGLMKRSKLYKAQDTVVINGLNGFIRRDGILIPSGKGAYELTATMTGFEPELLPQKLESIMTEVISLAGAT